MWSPIIFSLLFVSPRTMNDVRIDAPADDPPTTPPRLSSAVSSLCVSVFEVRIGEAPLATAAEKHAARRSDRLDERLGVGDLAIARVNHREIRRAVLAPQLQARPVVVVIIVFAGGRDDDDRRAWSAGEIDEALDDCRILHVAADDHQRALVRPMLVGANERTNQQKRAPAQSS